MENNTVLLQKTWKGKLADKDMKFILGRFENIDDKKALQLSTQPLKSPILVWIISLFFGGLGIDRFYKGDYFLGALKLVILVSTVALEINLDIDNEVFLRMPFFVIALSELITIFSSTRKDNLIKVLKALASVNANK